MAVTEILSGFENHAFTGMTLIEPSKALDSVPINWESQTICYTFYNSYSKSRKLFV